MLGERPRYIEGGACRYERMDGGGGGAFVDVSGEFCVESWSLVGRAYGEHAERKPEPAVA